MAQFFTLLPVLLLLMAAYNPIVCPSSKIYSDRRDRAPYIEPNEHSPQYLADAGGLGASRSRKVQNPVPPPPQRSFALNNQKTVHQSNDDEINERIESVFDTKFGPGLHLFKNTAPNDSPPHLNSFDSEYMHADQPHPPPSPPSVSSPPSSSSKYSTEPGFFKVQRSPTGKLDVVYNKDYVPSKAVNATNDGNNSSSGNVEQDQRTDSPHESLVDEETTTASPPSNPLQKPSRIHFPTEEPEKEEINYTVNSNDCVEKDGEISGKPFCTQLRNYPEKTHLEQIIKKKFSNLELFFGEDLVLPQNISQRMNNEPDEEFLCRSRTRVIYPQAGLNKDYNWLVIVNIPNYKQGIRIEECLNEGSICGESQGVMLPKQYSATCKQSYIYRSLVAFTNETVIRDQFKMPSCCKCVLKAIRQPDQQ